MAADVLPVASVNGMHAGAGPGPGCLTPLPYTIDSSCPIALPSRQQSGPSWPFAAAGPSNVVEQDGPVAYVKRRYLETLFLSEVLSPIHHLVQDVLRMETGRSIVETLQPLLLILSQIEQRHRKVLQPVITRLTSASTETAVVVAEEALQASSLPVEEQGVLRVAVELRMGCRAVAEGGVVQTRKLCEELERRETLIQVALWFVYVRFAPPPSQPKKRKREMRKSASTPSSSALDDPPATLEILVDRLSVWSAVADLGIGIEDPKERADDVQTMLQGFWTKVVVPFLLDHQPELCAAFHLKVFARPISPRLAPSHPKKSRKPALTRPRPSSDAPTLRLDQTTTGATSKAPSEGSRASSPRQRSLSRSLSARPDVRDRSQSVDPTPDSDLVQLGHPKKGLLRAASGAGRDLFKGRQVGLMRRTSSSVAAKRSRVEAQSGLSFGRTESQIKMPGLLGRKPSDPSKNRRINSDDQSQSQNQSQTLIFATPSKPKLANSIFGPRLSQYVAPTPIREEPSSVERNLPSYVTETPVAPGRISRGVLESDGIPNSVAETPEAGGQRILPPSTGRSYAGMAINALSNAQRDRVPGSDDESELGELMVMTDDEDDSVPDTPAR